MVGSIARTWWSAGFSRGWMDGWIVENCIFFLLQMANTKSCSVLWLLLLLLLLLLSPREVFGEHQQCNNVVLETSSAEAAYQNSGGSRSTGLPFASRSAVYARHGMAATSQPLSTQVALDILKLGGSAVDAAIAANALEGVVEPMMNGLGGDLMALVWDESSSQLQGYNGAGRAPMDQSLEDVRAGLAAIGEDFLPDRGPLTVTVPGSARGWCDLSERYGKLPLATVLAPAIRYASEGFPVSPVISSEWADTAPVPDDAGLTSGGAYPDAGAGFAATFFLNGTTPKAGDIFANPDLAATLQRLADLGCDDGFYGADSVTAMAIEAFEDQSGLRLTAAGDMAQHNGEWVTPLNTTYHDEWVVHELPPNPQGLVALQMLNILEGFNFSDDGGGFAFNKADYLHVMVEAKKLAFADAAAFYADPSFVDVPVEGLLSKAYAADRRKLINMTMAALKVERGDPSAYTGKETQEGGLKEEKRGGREWRESLESKYGGDTIYLTVADEEGNMVSLIQSLYNGFGSGLVVPGLGFALQDRGALFAVEDGHANVYAPGKRPFHTIMPGFVTRIDTSRPHSSSQQSKGEPWLSFGVMGGFMQPQGQVQILVNLLDFGMGLQEAGDAARWYHTGDNEPTGRTMTDGGEVQLEGGVCEGVAVELRRRGHQVVRRANGGGYQAIQRATKQRDVNDSNDKDKDGTPRFVYTGATEMRKDGQAAGW